MMRISLRWKLVAASLLPSAAVFAAAFWLASALTRRVLEQELGQRLIAVAEATAATLPADRLVLLGPGDEGSRTYAHVLARLSSMREATHAARLYVVDPRGRLLCDTAGQGSVGEPVPELDRDRLELGEALRGKPQASAVLFKGTHGAYFKSGYAPVPGADGRPVAVVAADASASFFAPLTSLRRALFTLAFAGSLLLALLFFAVGSGLIAPVFSLVRAARAIGRGDLATPVALRQGDELGVLAEGMEQMRLGLAARDRQLQMMLAGVAHEVRNPLGGMELYAGLLAEDLRGEPDKLALLAKIRRELDYLGALVDDFLDFARNRPLQLEPIALAPFAQELCELAQPFLEARRLTLRRRVDGAQEAALGDRAGLRRAVLNLIKNAAEASPEGGAVDLEVRVQGEVCVLAVADEGPGVGSDVRAAIFEPFFTTKEKGTGLGLAFARKIVESHGGRLELAEAKRGARFVATLPLRGT